MSKKVIIVGIILAVAVAGGVLYRVTQTHNNGVKHADVKTAGHEDGTEHKEEVDAHEGHDGHGEAGSITMAAELQKQNGVAVASAKKQRLAGLISATGRVEANADRIAHVSPRISGKIVAVKASLGIVWPPARCW